jgi:hypothetical protein
MTIMKKGFVILQRGSFGFTGSQISITNPHVGLVVGTALRFDFKYGLVIPSGKSASAQPPKVDETVP